MTEIKWNELCGSAEDVFRGNRARDRAYKEFQNELSFLATHNETARALKDDIEYCIFTSMNMRTDARDWATRQPQHPLKSIKNAIEYLNSINSQK